MAGTAGGKPFKHILEPGERIAEVLFGLIMVLTFTGSLSVTAGPEEVRTMLIVALGCNTAWGIIDGIFYLMGCLAEKGRDIRTWRAFRGAPDRESARQVIAGALPPILAATLGSAELEAMREKLERLPDPPLHPRLHRHEWLGAVAVFWWVFVTTFPVAIPFLFMGDVRQAMRVSNVIAIAMLFLAGYLFGRCAHYRPLQTGLAAVLVGCILVALTIALGG